MTSTVREFKDVDLDKNNPKSSSSSWVWWPDRQHDQLCVGNVSFKVRACMMDCNGVNNRYLVIKYYICTLSTLVGTCVGFTRKYFCLWKLCLYNTYRYMY